MQGGWSALKTRRPGWHLIRTVAGLGSMYVGFYAIARMAFADYVAISFTAPLFGTLLSIPLLRSEEHTSELQSLMRISYAVFCLTKQNKNKQYNSYTITT